MNLELTDEERALVRFHLEKGQHGIQLEEIDVIILKLQGGKMKAEYRLQHRMTPDIAGQLYCDGCPGLQDTCQDPRHNYTDEQWLEAAPAELTKEAK